MNVEEKIKNSSLSGTQDKISTLIFSQKECNLIADIIKFCKLFNMWDGICFIKKDCCITSEKPRDEEEENKCCQNTFQGIDSVYVLKEINPRDFVFTCMGLIDDDEWIDETAMFTIASYGEYGKFQMIFDETAYDGEIRKLSIVAKKLILSKDKDYIEDLKNEMTLEQSVDLGNGERSFLEPDDFPDYETYLLEESFVENEWEEDFINFDNEFIKSSEKENFAVLGIFEDILKKHGVSLDYRRTNVYNVFPIDKG